MTTLTEPMSQLAEHVRYRIGSRAVQTGTARTDELTRLVVMHWPHRHLEEAKSKNAKAIDHAMALLRAQVREHWEARHGVGPVWAMMLAGTVVAIAHVILDLWYSDTAWAERLEEMGRILRSSK